MHAPSSHRLSRLLLISVASCSLLGVGSGAFATETTELLKTAEAACLEAAKANGWRPELAKVISSQALGDDRVVVVFDLSKDGVNTARLTCPYSAKEGVATSFTKRKAEVGSAPEGVEAAPPGIAVTPGKAWWLLLPLALALGSWLWLRGRDGTVGHAYASTGVTTGAGTGSWYGAEAAARDGLVAVHANADGSSRVLRQIRNGDTFEITGVRRRDSDNVEWLEVNSGGWVRDGETRYDRNNVR
ncbi:MAG: hypothetical protein VKO26_09430 [Cyanobacteriota bacterium]|nr:hypothetical protein [Cyanobacteriota bacterium]